MDMLSKEKYFMILFLQGEEVDDGEINSMLSDLNMNHTVLIYSICLTMTSIKELTPVRDTIT